MKRLISLAIRRVVVATPPWLRNLGKHLGLRSVTNKLLTKADGELIVQQTWAAYFKNHRDEYLKTWQETFHLREILRLCQLTETSRVLDVGCGISSVLHFVPGMRFGIDPLASEYHQLYHYPARLMVLPGTGEQLPFKAGVFRAVFCSNALDHTANPRQVVTEIRRVLEPNGFFILRVDVFDRKTKRDPAHPYCLSQTSCLKLLKNKFAIIFLAVGDDKAFDPEPGRKLLTLVALRH